MKTWNVLLGFYELKKIVWLILFIEKNTYYMMYIRFEIRNMPYIMGMQSACYIWFQLSCSIANFNFTLKNNWTKN
jgi:hypothetical protein